MSADMQNFTKALVFSQDQNVALVEDTSSQEI